MKELQTSCKSKRLWVLDNRNDMAFGIKWQTGCVEMRRRGWSTKKDERGF